MNLSIFRWRSLKTRMVRFTLIIFVLSVWLLAIYLNNILRQDMQKLLGDQQLSAATFVASDLNDELESRLRALKTLADEMSPALLDRKDELQNVLEGRTFLQDLFNFGVIVVDVEGRVVADVPLWRGRTGLNLIDRDDVLMALKQGRSGVGRPVLDKKSGLPLVSMAAPIRGSQGKIVGAVAGLTQLGEPSFMDHVSRHGYGKRGDVLVASRQHRIIITGSDQRRVMEQFTAPGIDPMVDQRVAGIQSTEVFVNPHGVEVLSSARAVPAADWFVEISLPTEEAFSPIRNVQRRLLLAALLLTLVAGAASWWMVRRELAPMLEAVQALALKRVPNQRRQLLPIRRDDELGELLGAFNALTARLDQREALFRQILDTSTVAIFVVDTQGRITQANRRMAEMFGYSSRDLVGREYVEMVQPGERKEAREKMLALLASAIADVNLDRLYWRADQTEFWGHLSGKRFVDADGLDKGLIGVIADISERKEAEERLKQRDNRLSTIIENFPGAISMIDSEMRLVTYNQQFKRLLAFPDALFDQPDLGLEHIFRFNAQRGEYGPGDVEQQVNERLERARKFEPHGFERVRPDGTVLEIQGLVVPGGGFVTVYLDVTERKRQEEAIRRSEVSLRRFRVAMDATEDAIYIVDRASMRFVDVNASASRMLGLTRDEIMESGPEGVLQMSREELAAIYDTLIAEGGAAAPVEALRKRRNGAQAWIEIRRHAKQFDEGWMIVTVARDITERKRMEDQVRQLAFYDPLTELPNRRLLNDRLRQSIAASKRSGCCGALMFLDLDNFKALNDRHGHGAGDFLLIEVAQRLKKCVRQIDTVARLGGDEFVVVVGDLSTDRAESTLQARGIAEKISVSLAEPYVLLMDQQDAVTRTIEHHCSASIGAVVFFDADGSQEDFFKWADTAMYQAKAAGSSLIRFWDSEAANFQ